MDGKLQLACTIFAAMLSSAFVEAIISERLREFTSMAVGAYTVTDSVSAGANGLNRHILDVALPDSGSNVYLLFQEYQFDKIVDTGLYEFQDVGGNIMMLRLHVTDRWLVNTRNPMSQASLNAITPKDFGQKQICGNLTYNELAQTYALEEGMCSKYTDHLTMEFRCEGLLILRKNPTQAHRFRKIRSYSEMLPSRWQPDTKPCKALSAYRKGAQRGSKSSLKKVFTGGKQEKKEGPVHQKPDNNGGPGHQKPDSDDSPDIENSRSEQV